MILWFFIKKIAGLAFSRFLDGLLKIAAFIIEHWRVILPLAIAAITLFYIYALRVECERNRRIIADKDAQIAQIYDDARKKATESYLKAEAATYLTHQSHQKQLGLILANAQSAIAQEIKKHEADNTLHGHQLNAYRDRLRIAVSESASKTDFAGIYGSGANGDAAVSRCADELSVCKEAGAMCAADYNYCYGYVQDLKMVYE